MKPEVRYNAMDDFMRTVFDKPVRGHLNGDTAVRSCLYIKSRYMRPPDDIWDLFGGEYTSEPPPPEDDVSHLLYTPLPADLPTMNKDVLIEMAAYYGDIDRYSRLRRPDPRYTITEDLPQHHVCKVVVTSTRFSTVKRARGNQCTLYHEQRPLTHSG